MSPKRIPPIKKYRRYDLPGTGEKVYRPVYRGRDIVLSQFPPTSLQYTTASEAQAHAERHEQRKRRQIKRFQEEEYRGEVLTRYAALLTIAVAAQEENDG